MEQEGKTTKKSIPRTIIFKRDGTGKNGPWFLFEVTFDNGDKGSFFSGSNPQTSFKEGIEVEYIIEKKQNGEFTNTTIYLPKPKGSGRKFNPSASNKQCALTNAVNLCISGKVDREEIYKTAEKLFSWLQKESNTDSQ